MNILLAYTSGAADRSDPYLNLLPSGLCYLHAVLSEAGFNPQLANFSAWRRQTVKRHLMALRPDLIGISQWTHNRFESLELARLARQANPACVVVMGGGHASFSYEEQLQSGVVDLVVIGEGETTLREIVERYANGQELTGIPGTVYRVVEQVMTAAPRPPIENLDTLPQPSRYLDHNTVGIDSRLQAEFVLTARGCPYTCHFCSSPAFWGRRVRFRSPGNIVDEMFYIRDHYGLIYFSLRDDTFTADRKRAAEFCRILIDRKAGLLWNCQSNVNSLNEELLILMKRAGCECVQLGVESGSPRILKQLGKGVDPERVVAVAEMIRRVGMNLSIYLISDIPGESEEDISHTRALIRKLRPDDGYVSPLAYYPGTRLYRDAVDAGQTTSGLFEDTAGPALYAQPGGTASRRLMKVFASLPAPAPDRFEKCKSLLGFCHTTNILAGEWFESAGRQDLALKEYQEIISAEPSNPWGWFLAGECLEESDQAAARNCFRKVVELVPNHGPALEKLAKK